MSTIGIGQSSSGPTKTYMCNRINCGKTVVVSAYQNMPPDGWSISELIADGHMCDVCTKEVAERQLQKLRPRLMADIAG